MDEPVALEASAALLEHLGEAVQAEVVRVGRVELLWNRPRSGQRAHELVELGSAPRMARRGASGRTSLRGRVVGIAVDRWPGAGRSVGAQALVRVRSRSTASRLAVARLAAGGPRRSRGA